MPVTDDKPTSRRYTIAISKGAALLDETRRLLGEWRPGEPFNLFAARVQEHGVLGNATAYRTRDIVRRVFAPRFLRPTDKPARILKHILGSGLPARTFTEMVFLYAARNDPLVYDFAVCGYWPAVRRGRTVLGTDAVLAFLAEAAGDGKLESPWSEEVSIKIARGLLGMLRDVGFLRETRRGRREIVDYHMSEEGTAILARELHEDGVTDSALCSHADWGLFGLSAAEVLERLDRLGEHRGVLVQRAGSVVHFTWFVKSIEEMIDVLAR